DAETPVVTIFGKSWRLHVRDVLRVSETENRAMIRETVQLLKEQGREVVYDAEHFFDGYQDSPKHALATLKAARDAGADTLVLCDTNGGTMPDRIEAVTREVAVAFPGVPLGIHAHNDADLGTANTLAAVRAGVRHVQGTFNGFGERAGNANLCSVLPNLLLKMGFEGLREGALAQLRNVSEFIYELANLRPSPRAPFVGASAFAHKAGMHVDAVRKNRTTFEHIEPEAVGNRRRILISELSGASNIFLKAVEMGLTLERSSPEVRQILKDLERLEKSGYEFEAAEASFKLLVQKILKKHRPYFTLLGFRTIVEKRAPDEPCITEATVKLRVGDEVEFMAGEGDGPVDALNNALRRALTRFYPSIANVALTDYRVRILDPETATAAKTRVLIESSDGTQSWDTIGVSTNLIEASWEALVDGVEYKLFLEEEKAGSADS
ncbi:MAG: citramalate synthase, partial [Kiritimatiellia bacterium]|nr:citramalate synthase [Kiritimatiellia bacterium]